MQKIIARVFTLAGLVLLAVAVWAGNRQHKILKHWPTVDAEVVESRVMQGADSDGVVTYSAAIQFRYTVNGKEYSTPVASNVSTSNYVSVKRQVDRYAPGSHHRIWHNPEEPADVSFDAGYNLSFFFMPVLFGGMGILFTGVGIGIQASLRRSEG